MNESVDDLLEKIAETIKSVKNLDNNDANLAHDMGSKYGSFRV